MGGRPRLIDDVLRVLAEIRALSRGRLQGQPVAVVRREATERVADATHRVHTTVHDAIARRLGLEADQFDQYNTPKLGSTASRMRSCEC